MPTFDTYYFNSGTSWVVPAGVTAIQVECFGSIPGITYPSYAMPQANYSGGSYSKSTNIAVTAGSTVYFNVGASGGNTWFNTSNVAPTSSSSTSSACLAVGGNTVSASQVAANCGDVKYAGGNGRVTTGITLTAQGGPAGPNGPGADVGDPYTNTGYSINGGGPYLFCQGGGANGGFQGSLGVPAYGRSGSGTDGMGSRFIAGSLIQGTTDSLGNYKYFNNIITNTYTTPNGVSWGLKGGGATSGVSGCCCSGQTWGLNPRSGFVAITVVAATQKSIVYIVPSATNNSIEQSFTLPTDFGSLISLEAFGGPGTLTSMPGAANYGGIGGGAYAKTLGASVTASMVAGSTTVYYLVGSRNTVNNGQDSYIRIGTSGPPSSTTDGVLAKGSLSVFSTSGSLGGATATSVGDTKYAGGNGGNGGGTNNVGGGGGLAGPLGAGGNGGAGSATASRGDGGGGASNGGSAGGAGTTTAGGTGGTITGGTGGTGATSSSVATSGTNGGGGGGGFGIVSFAGGAAGGILNNSIYAIRGGGGDATPGTAVHTDPSPLISGYGLVVFTYVPNSDVTAALTGSSSSASGGALSPGQTLNQTLSSGSADALAGTLTNSQTLTQALSSAIAEAFGGTFVPSNDQVVNLSSALASASGGTLTNSQLITQALTGAFVDGRTSSFPVFLELVSASATGATGLFGYVNTGWQPINTSGGASTWTDVDTQQG